MKAEIAFLPTAICEIKCSAAAEAQPGSRHRSTFDEDPFARLFPGTRVEADLASASPV